MTEWRYEKYGTTKRACPWLIGSWWFLTQQKILKNKNKHVQTMTNFVGIIEDIYLELYVGISSLRRPKNVNISEIAIPIKCHLLK